MQAADERWAGRVSGIIYVNVYWFHIYILVYMTVPSPSGVILTLLVPIFSDLHLICSSPRDSGAKPNCFNSEDYAWYDRGYLPRMPDFGKGARPEDKQAASLRLATNSLIGDVLTIAELLQGVQQKIAILQ